MNLCVAAASVVAFVLMSVTRWWWFALVSLFRVFSDWFPEKGFFAYVCKTYSIERGEEKKEYN